MAWLTRALLLVLLVLMALRALGRLFAGLAQGMAPGGAEGGRDRPGVQMMRDPVCGTFVAPARALTARDGDRLHYFCSEKCLRAFQSGQSQRRASAK